MEKPMCMACWTLLDVDGARFTCTNPRCQQLSVAHTHNGKTVRVITRLSALAVSAPDPESQRK